MTNVNNYLLVPMLIIGEKIVYIFPWMHKMYQWFDRERKVIFDCVRSAVVENYGIGRRESTRVAVIGTCQVILMQFFFSNQPRLSSTSLRKFSRQFCRWMDRDRKESEEWRRQREKKQRSWRESVC